MAGAANQERALSAFVAAKADIDAMLARLTAHSAEHFGIAPDDVNWTGTVALEEIAAKLRRVSDFTFGEGEYA